MSAPAVAAPAARPSPWLDAAVVAVPAVTLAGAAVFGPSSSVLLLGIALVALIGLWFVVGRRALDGRAGWLPMVVLLVAVSGFGAWVSPAFATFQVLAFPLVWLLAPGMRSAVVANAVLAAAVATGYAIATSIGEALAVEGVSLAFSLAMGVWVSRIEERSEERRVLLDRLTAAQEQLAVLHRDAGALAERERLARDLHDTLTQSLAGVVMLAERARSRHPADAQLVVLEDSARQAMAEARALVTAGAAVALDGGLRGALEVLAERFERETGLAVSVDVRAEVPRDLEVVLLRCAQEGVANVRKHAAAERVALAVRTDDGRAVLTVTDDGRGPTGGAGFGIAGMRDRLHLVDGDVALTAAGERGALLTVRVPLAEAAR